MEDIGKIMMITGGLFAAAGLLLWLSGSKLSWFGHLPGDIRIEKEGFRLYVPLVSMFLLSVAIFVVRWIVRKFTDY